MSGLEDKAIEIITQLQHQVPVATKLALQTAEVSALSNLAGGVVALGFLATLILIYRYLYRPWEAASDHSYGGEPEVMIAAAVLWLAMAISAVIAAAIFFDPWTWVSIARPDLYLAHQLIR